MMVLPELDTYGILKKYAEHPEDKLASGALLMLLKRAKRRINWELHDFLGFNMPYQDKLALRLDSEQLLSDNEKSEEEPEQRNLTVSDWTSMSEADAKAAYMALLRDSGMMPEMDPGGSMNKDNSNS